MPNLKNLFIPLEIDFALAGIVIKMVKENSNLIGFYHYDKDAVEKNYEQ